VELSADSRTTAGLILLTVLAVEWGGLVVLRMTRGQRPATPFQTTFSRAGHGHAGVLVVFALVGLMLADAADLDGAFEIVARNGIWLAAILFPLGFFLSSSGQDVTEPNRLIVLVYVGAVSLGAAVLTLGIGLITAD
jgi:hypothetical protein